MNTENKRDVVPTLLIALLAFAAGAALVKDTKVRPEVRLSAATSAPSDKCAKLVAALRQDRFVAYTPSEYDPFSKSKSFASIEGIRQDLEVIRPYFTGIVTYSCDSLQGMDQIVPVAKDFDMRVIVGIWNVKSAHEIATAVDLAARYPDTVMGLIVGNETMLRGGSFEAVAASLQLVRRALPQVPLSTSEPVSAYGKDELRELVDFHSPNIHWIFHDRQSQNASEATAWLWERGLALGELPSGDKPVLLKEHGFPSGPQPFSEALQSNYWSQAATRYGGSKPVGLVFFEAFDLPWKSRSNPSEFSESEAHWGAWTRERRPKPVVNVLKPSKSTTKGTQ